MIFHVVLLLITAAIAIQLAIFSWRYSLPYKTSFILLMLSIADWSFGYAMELRSPHVYEKLFWVKIQYFGIVLVPLVLFILIFQYAGYEKWLIKRKIFFLSIIPIITLLLAWTNNLHHLIWRKIGVIQKDHFILLHFEYGLWAKISTTYAYILILFAIFSLLRIFSFSHHLYKKQATLLLISMLAPFIGNIMYILEFSYFDLTPFAFLISGIVFSLSFAYHLFNIKPIAIDYLIENMKDGIIALDKYHRIMIINPTAKKILGYEKLKGKIIDDFSDFYPELPTHLKESEIKREIVIQRNGRKSYYELLVSPLYDKYKNLIGYLIILHDITERKEAEEALNKALEYERKFKSETAHYFLNPICIAKGYMGLAKEKNGKKEVEKAIKAIERIENVVINIIEKGRIIE